MSDSYPEYLNPFAEDVKPKSRLSISHSFKEFKRTLRQSFRIKKKEEAPVTIRRKTETFQRIPRTPVSYPNYRPDALPRSRFQERLKLEPSTSRSGPNPFEEDKNSTKSTLRKKTKKKAPLPPKSLSSQDINNDNLDVPSHGSRWSLTSEDTNYSNSIQENDNVEDDNEGVLEKIIDFNKKMEKLQDDSNNNIITTEEINHKHISNTDISKPSIEEIDSSQLVKSKEETDVRLLENNSETNVDNSFDVENDKIVASDITNEDNVICENNKNSISVKDNEATTEIDGREPFLYYEKQLLYIADSKDELNDSEVYTNRISLQISDTSEEDECNNNNYDDNQSDTKSDTPVPKQRKNKLTKTALLGM